MAKSEIINNDALTVRVDESVADILSETSDVIEQTLNTIENTVERVVTVTRNNPWLFVAGAVVGLGVGGFFAYRYAAKKTALECDEILKVEIEAARTLYSRQAKAGDFETPEAALAALHPQAVVAGEALVEYSGGAKVPYNRPEDVTVTAPAEDPRPEIRNVFAAAIDPTTWDQRLELADREVNPGKPYVISFEEFEDNPDHNEQITLTYYAGDDMLADASDKPVDNPDYIVGNDNLTRFGAGSNDNNVVYIRNEKVSADFEVLRSEGSYGVEVLGDLAGELRHSATRHPNRVRNTAIPRRFRENDDE